MAGCLLEQVACLMTAALSRCFALNAIPHVENVPPVLLVQNCAHVEWHWYWLTCGESPTQNQHVEAWAHDLTTEHHHQALCSQQLIQRQVWDVEARKICCSGTAVPVPALVSDHGYQTAARYHADERGQVRKTWRELLADPYH